MTRSSPASPGTTLSRDGRFTTERRKDAQVERFVIEYAIGSGRHAMTFATLTDRDPTHPTMLEHRLTVFAASRPSWSHSRALAQGAFERQHAERMLHVLDAHAGLLPLPRDEIVKPGPDQLDESTMIANVSCEKCHGPGGTHVEAARREATGQALAMPLGPGRFSPVEEITFCGSCHRLPRDDHPRGHSGS